MSGAAAEREPRGFALLLVLWAVMILGIIAVAMLAGSGAAQRQAYGGVDLLRRTALEDAAISRAVAGVLADQNAPKTGSLGLSKKPRWPRDGTPVTISFDGHDITVTIQDESGKVDLNAATKDTLTALLRTTEMGGADVEDLVNHILDWRGNPKDTAKAGVIPVEYQGLGYSYHSRHGAFQSIDELRLVDGMAPEVYDQLAPGITVYSGSKDVDPDTAPLVALMTLPGLDKEKAIDVIAGRARGIPYTPPPGQTATTPAGGAPDSGAPAPAAGAAAAAAPSGGAVGHALTITAAVVLDDKRLAMRREIVRVVGPGPPVFLVLRDEEWLQRR